MRCSARPFGVVPPMPPPRSASRVSNRIMPPKRRKSLILATAASEGSRLALGDRPVEERIERDVVRLDIDRHRLGRLDGGAVEERAAEALQPGGADRVDPRVAGQHIGEHGLVRGVAARRPSASARLRLGAAGAERERRPAAARRPPPGAAPRQRRAEPARDARASPARRRASSISASAISQGPSRISAGRSSVSTVTPVGKRRKRRERGRPARITFSATRRSPLA